MEPIHSQEVTAFSFSDLPNEVGVKIFSFLDLPDLCRVQRVEKKCLELSLDQTLWQRFRIGPADIQQEIIKTQRCFEDYLDQRLVLSNSTINHALESCPAYLLRDVHIRIDSPRRCVITGQALKAIQRKNPNVRSLHLNTTDVCQFEHLNDLDLVEFVKSSPKLESLSLMSCTHVTVSGLRAISDAGHALRKISLQSDILNDALVESIVSTHPNLTLLRIAGRSREITNASLRSIATHCSQMQELDIRIYTQAFSLKAIYSLLPKLKQVSTFSLQGSKHASNKLIFLISKHLPNIRSLYLGNCKKITTKSIKTIAKRLTKVESLYLIGCKNPKKLTNKFQEMRKTGYFATLNQYQISC